MYRSRDLLLLPNVLSAARIPLAAVFPFVADRLPLALAVLGAAAATDVLDGFLARRLHQATPIGALVDGVADKVFGVSVVVSLVAVGSLAPPLAFLLATRELGELPLALRAIAIGRANDASVDRRANAFGKAATSFELVTVIAALFHWSHLVALVGVTAVIGFVAAATYWMRELRETRQANAYAP